MILLLFGENLVITCDFKPGKTSEEPEFLKEMHMYSDLHLEESVTPDVNEDRVSHHYDHEQEHLETIVVFNLQV